jgi:hypothetical protein
MEDSTIACTQEIVPLQTPGIDDMMQPEIGGEEEENFEIEDIDDGEEEKELLEDELRRLQKVDSVATITSLRMKPEKFAIQYSTVQIGSNANGQIHPFF